MGKGGDNNAAIKKGVKITLEELSKHRVQDDAWMSYKGRVYDVSGWNGHPGGSVIFTHAGDDFTDIFAAFHSPTAIKHMEQFYIGDLDESVIPEGLYANKFKPDKQKKFEEGYRELRAQILALGLFKSDPWYYVMKVLSNFLILSISIACVTMSSSMMTHFIGALVLGLFWQQCGWLAHDFLHHQVFRNRTYGNLMGVFIGNVCQGFSVQWWKCKHNIHHAVPNLHESSPQAADGDPDIDTMPFLAWSKTMAKHAKPGSFFIRWQAYIYFPLLLGARLAWAYQSWTFQFGGTGEWAMKNAEEDNKKTQHPILEKIGLIVHYLALLYIMSFMPLLNALMYFFVAETSCGLFLALVFGLGHNGMAVYPADERPDFWKLQVSTTRNIAPNWFVDFFCGGLQYQVDHHLFPMLPRHNLPKVHAMVEAFCKEHDVTYHETDMWVGTCEVLSHLSEISRDFINEFPAM